MTESLFNIDLLTAITDVYNIWNSTDGPIIYNYWLKTGLVRDRMNSEQATLHHVGEIGSIDFYSSLEAEDNCFDRTV